ncbi:hypothetical protein CLOM621_08727 [Clostridium sp. M62/1]|nr:hypothetical protein CLOM621_08727 [Clostridium sp. M62/1]
MRTRRNSVLAPFGRQRLGAGIITAPRLLYHTLHFLWQIIFLTFKINLRIETGASFFSCRFLHLVPAGKISGNNQTRLRTKGSRKMQIKGWK